MSTFSTEMKQMFKMWLYKLASSPVGGGNKLSQGHIRHLPPTYNLNEICCFLGFQKHNPSVTHFELGRGEVIISKLNFLMDVLISTYCTG